MRLSEHVLPHHLKPVIFPDLRPYFMRPVVRGEWRVEAFRLSRREVSLIQLQDSVNRRYMESWGLLPDHTYLRLLHNGSVVMSTTPSEIRANEQFVREARGRVLIGGLGLGMCLMAVQDLPEVNGVTVIELAPEVIEIARARLPLNSKVEIVRADVFKWRPPKGAEKYDTIYFDIWADITPDNVREMGRLHRIYRRYLAPDGWIGSWRYADCKRLARSQRGEPWGRGG